MRRVRHWTGGTLLVGFLAAALGGCGGSSSSKGDEGSDGDGGATSGGSGGTTSGGGGTDGGTTDGTTASNTGDETAASSTSGNTTGGIVPGEPVPFEDYAAGVSAILCGWLTPCCTGLGIPVTEMACSQTFATSLEEENAAADPNNYTYDAEAAGACLVAAGEFYDQVGCELVDPVSGIAASAAAVCDTVFQGKLEPGAPCAGDIECAVTPGDDPECTELDFGSGTTVCVVERRAAEGESCYWSCTGNPTVHSCFAIPAAESPALQGKCYSDDHLYCADGVCAAQPSLGEPCSDDATCSEGYCSATGECTAGKAEGLDCTASAQCSGGLYCASETCAPRKATGEPCELSEECQSDYCNDYECAEGADVEALAFVCAIAAAQP